MRDYDVRLKEATRTLSFTDFPTQVVIETIAACNLRCPACPSHLLERPRGEMSDELFHKLIDEIAAEGPDTEMYPAYMGEPLLSRRIFDHLRYAKALGLTKIYMNTNAMLLTEEASRQLVSSGVDRIIVSIDGFSAETYEPRRRGGVYEKVKAQTEHLLRCRDEAASPLEVWVQMIVDKGNAHEEEAFKAHWLEKGAIVKIRPQLTWGGRVGAWDGKAAMCDADHEARFDLGDARRQTLKEIWNATFRELREKHLQGDFSHPLCRDCHDWKVGKSEVFRPDGR